MSRKYKEFGDSCVECKVKFEAKGSHSHNAKGLCRMCYSKWMRIEGHSHCDVCGIKLPNRQAKPLCKICKLSINTGIIQNEQHRLSKRSKYQHTAYSQRLELAHTFSIKEADEIRMLLIRYKWGLISELHKFIVVNHYINIWGNEPSLDVFTPEEQVKFMLQRLKSYYDKNKELIYNLHVKRTKRRNSRNNKVT